MSLCDGLVSTHMLDFIFRLIVLCVVVVLHKDILHCILDIFRHFKELLRVFDTEPSRLIALLLLLIWFLAVVVLLK